MAPADPSHAPRSCHGALVFSPVTRPGSDLAWVPNKVSLYSSVAGPTAPFAVNHQLALVQGRVLSHCRIVSQHDGSRFRAGFLIEHRSAAANNNPGPNERSSPVQSSRASKLNPSSLHPHPSKRQGVKFNSPTGPSSVKSQPRGPRRFSCISPRTTVSVRELSFFGHRITLDPSDVVNFELRSAGKGRAVLSVREKQQSPSLSRSRCPAKPL